jgi:4-hydroxy-2-oxoheptanedioate aldolase
MNQERLRQALGAKEVLYGTWVQTPSPEVVEILGWSGWDFVILDLEHGPYGPEGLPHLIRAAEASETAPFVRVPLTAPQEVGKALDLGAAGIVIPGVRSADDGPHTGAEDPRPRPGSSITRRCHSQLSPPKTRPSR